MKILEKQNALLSNYEVYQHLVDQQKRNKTQKKKVPGNLATVTDEVIAYLQTKPSPLADQGKNHVYDQTTFQRLLDRIRDAHFKTELVQAEVLMILNLRPSSIAQLAAILEDAEERLSEDEQNKLLDIIGDVLGRDETTENGDQAIESVENGN
ncbi:RNA polymerase II [Apodospora peruviana]|uniref:DNA-directed RNA polymerase III subunit RPC9 n=1 Tax=Apodospora peruviana TaxID=516989 RepID=A0AAE0HYA5_9PEZI|nr:RNA polymerase II [Apodospora peruviana]